MTHTRRILLLLGLVLAGPASAELQLVSGAPFGPNHAANGPSTLEAATPDQRFVLRTTTANNLVPGIVDSNGVEDVYLLDRQSGTYELISRSAANANRAADDKSFGRQLTADGRFVVFESLADDLIPGFVFGGDSPSQRDIYLFDRQSGTLELVSHASGSSSTTADKSARTKTLSADGRFVGFESAATNLVVEGAGNTRLQVYQYDRTFGTNLLVSDQAAVAGNPANGTSFLQDMTPDGRYLLLTSQATDFAAGLSDTSGSNDAFVFDRVTDAVELISRDAANPLQTRGGTAVEISDDGRFVSLESTTTLLQAGLTDGNGAGRDCFVFDRQSGLARVASRTAASATVSGNSGSSCGPLAQNGDVAVSSGATNLIAGFVDNNASNSDLFLYTRASDNLSLVSHAQGSSVQGANHWVFYSVFSPNERYLGFQSPATNLQNGVTDSNAEEDTFVFDRMDSSIVLVSRGPGNTTLAGDLESTRVGNDGSVLFATTRPLDATATDTRNHKDVFRFSAASSLVRLESRAGLSGLETVTSQTANSYLPPRITNNGLWVVWDDALYSRATRTNFPIGHAAVDPGTPANARVLTRYSSPEGRFVTLASEATNLVNGLDDEILTLDLFLHDRLLDTTTLLTHEPGSPWITNARFAAAEALWASDDARLFLLRNQTQIEGPNLFLYDRLTQTAEILDHGFGGVTEPGNYGSEKAWLKNDHSVAVVESRSWNLVPGYVDHNDYFQGDLEAGENKVLGFFVRPTELYHFDRVTHETRLITRQAGTVADGPESGYADNFRVTASGQDVFYSHFSDLLVAGQVVSVEPLQNLFHWNRTTNTNQLLIHATGEPTTAPCSGHTRLVDITPDGRYVLFNSDCALVVGDTNGIPDAYLLDRNTSQISLITHATNDPATAIGGSASDLDDSAAKIVVHLAEVPYLQFRATGVRQLLTPSYIDPMIGVPANFVHATPDLSGILLATEDSRLATFDGNVEVDLFLFTFDELFADGFETGTTGRWSFTLP